MKKKAIVIGAGPAGLGAAFSLKNKNYDVIVLDNRETLGGLCGSFSVNNFIFDRFIHVSFAKDPEILKYYQESGDIISFSPKMYNRYKNLWLPHPAQYNLYQLPLKKKLNIIWAFLFKNKFVVNNYRDWLYQSYGKAFSDEFPVKYTHLYWQTDPSDMEIKWLNGRMYNLSLWKLIKGAFIKSEKISYYASSFSYPKRGGFSHFFDYLASFLNIKLNSQVVKIDTKNKFVKTKDNQEYNFDILINTTPLNELCYLIEDTGENIKEESSHLNYTSGYIVSIGLNKDPSFNDALYFYNYNTDILSARVYFPHKKSKANCPENKYSIQIEIYTRNGKNIDIESSEFKYTVKEVLSYCQIKDENVLFQDIRFEKFANIIFDNNIYKTRDILLKYYQSKGIISIGRFGAWDYLWSFQSLRQGLDVVKNYSL